MRRSGLAPLLKPIGWLALAAFGLVYLFPLYWLLNTSVKGRAELFGSTPTLFAQDPTLDPYRSVLFDRGFVGLIRNSLIVCSLTVLLTLAISLAITYPLTRLPMSRRVRVGVLNWALSLRFLPPIAVVVPYFVIVRTIGLFNHPLALVFVYTLSNLPFGIWMLKGFMSEVPQEVEEAAYVDGASRAVAFRRVLLPLVAPGLLAAGVIIFAFSWSEFLFALILTSTRDAQTFPVGVQGLVTQFEIIWNEMAAAGVIAIAIPLVLMLLARRYVLAGLTFGVIREK
jgi:multiple sugar transport system permease protein